MNWQGLGLGLAVWVCTGAVVAQEPPSRRWDKPGEFLGLGDLTTQGSLDAIQGSLDALHLFHPVLLEIPETLEALETPETPETFKVLETIPPIRMPAGADSRLTVGKADNWQSGLGYMFLASPTGTFPSRENAGVRVSYDDSRLWTASFPSLKGFKGLQPSATVGLQANERLRGATDRAVYMQLGIKPGYELRLPGDHPVVASMPVTVGLGSDQDDFVRSKSSSFNYLDIGLAVGIPLSPVSRHSNSWGLTAGVNFLFLGDGRQSLNGGDDFDVMASITFGFEF